MDTILGLPGVPRKVTLANAYGEDEKMQIELRRLQSKAAEMKNPGEGLRQPPTESAFYTAAIGAVRAHLQ